MAQSKNNASSNIVYECLKKDILNLKLAPGCAISETDMASKYNVSRTPVRDAFKALAQEGLLEVKPHIGTFVSLIDINQISDVLYIRKVIEQSILKDLCSSFCEADTLKLEFSLNNQKQLLNNDNSCDDIASQFIKYDNNFHKLIFRIAGKESIWDMIFGLNPHYERFRALINLYGDNNIQNLYTEHCAIVKALNEKDYNTLKEHINKHIYDGFKNSSNIIMEYSHYFVNYHE